MSLYVKVVKILEKHEPSRSTSRALSFLSGHHGNSSSGSRTLHLGRIPADEASAVQNYVEHMLFLLMEEEAGQGRRKCNILQSRCCALGLLIGNDVLGTRRSHGSHPGVCGSGGRDGEAVSVEPEEAVHRGHEAGAAQDVPDAVISGQTASAAPQTGSTAAHDAAHLLCWSRNRSVGNQVVPHILSTAWLGSTANNFSVWAYSTFRDGSEAYYQLELVSVAGCVASEVLSVCYLDVTCRHRRGGGGGAGPAAEPAMCSSGQRSICAGTVFPLQSGPGSRQLPALLAAHPVYTQVGSKNIPLGILFVLSTDLTHFRLRSCWSWREYKSLVGWMDGVCLESLRL